MKQTRTKIIATTKRVADFALITIQVLAFLALCFLVIYSIAKFWAAQS